ncbi:hypothetical protein [Microcoleus anatoxicus]|uniref:Uncharacterized protein n=1 Tax=Microcoleus anatoxicus PTRS2 TaxID=2705321 RepID=A0ABU8YQU7_9CYAN
MPAISPRESIKDKLDVRLCEYWDKAMSEADLRANQQQPHSAVQSDAEPLELNSLAVWGLEPIDPTPKDPGAVVVDTPEADWETVDFPNAISVNAIPTTSEGKNLPSQTEVPLTDISPISDHLKNLLANTEQAKGKGSTPVTLMQALHECNRDLLGRISQLETALQESQTKLQQREALLEKQNAELQNTQAQLTRLFGKLEVSNQTLQSQEILVENLTNQLATSQTRLATVERESAATVMRYNEQLHQLVTTENVCKELRSRLHRQQRHTLQFKAALEKSLEMPHPKSIAPTEPVENTEDTASAQLESLLAAVKSQNVPVSPIFNTSPVQPWSDPWEAQPEVGTSQGCIGPESTVSQEFNTLASASGIELHENENFSQPDAATESSPSIVEAPPETESAKGKYSSPELVRAAKILSSVETFGIQQVRSSAAQPMAVEEPHWLTSITSPRSPAKKRRSLADIELPSFR